MLPALVFDQYAVDLRQIEPTSEAHAIFVFRNRSNHVVEIDEVEPSCGCLTPIIEPRTVAAGESGRIVLRIQPANESPGPHQYHAYVRYRDSLPREVKLLFKVVIPDQQVLVRPPALIVYFSGDETVSHELKVIDRRPAPCTVTHVETTHPLVHAVIGRREIAADGQVEQQIRVLIEPTVRIGEMQSAVVTIHTNDPQVPMLRVPLRFQRVDSPRNPGQPSDILPSSSAPRSD